MARAVAFTGLRHQRSPMAGGFFASSALRDLALIQTLATISRDLITAYLSPVTAFPFQKKNARSLVLKVKILLSFFESLKDSSFSAFLPSSATVCLKELYILIFRSRLLFLVQQVVAFVAKPAYFRPFSRFKSGNRHDSRYFASLSVDLWEQLQLLQGQARKSKLHMDPQDELLQLRIFSFHDEFEKGRAPDRGELRFAFVDQLGVKNAQTCRLEIVFLEEQIFNDEEDVSDPSILGGVVALTRLGISWVSLWMQPSERHQFRLLLDFHSLAISVT